MTRMKRRYGVYCPSGVQYNKLQSAASKASSASFSSSSSILKPKRRFGVYCAADASSAKTQLQKLQKLFTNIEYSKRNYKRRFNVVVDDNDRMRMLDFKKELNDAWDKNNSSSSRDSRRDSSRDSRRDSILCNSSSFSSSSKNNHSTSHHKSSVSKVSSEESMDNLQRIEAVRILLQTKKKKTPILSPSPYDVIVNSSSSSSSKSSLSSSNNSNNEKHNAVGLTKYLETLYLSEYTLAETELERSLIVCTVLDSVKRVGGKFLKESTLQDDDNYDDNDNDQDGTTNTTCCCCCYWEVNDWDSMKNIKDTFRLLLLENNRKRKKRSSSMRLNRDY